MREGILLGGNWIIDQLKVVDVYPQEQTLANIQSQSFGNGGSAYNVVKALFLLGFTAKLGAIGVVGKDAFGKMILQDCNSMNVCVSQLISTEEKGTSYTDVMSVAATGKRTFFHYRGANALLGENHFDFEKTNCKIFHLGYLLLLDGLDKIDETGSTGAANVLKKAQRSGLITSIDLVSEDSYRFEKIVSPALPYVDYLFINEFELSRLTAIETCFENKIIKKNCLLAIEKVFAMGVNKCVILHFEAGAIAVSKTGEQISQSAINLPPEKIIGAVGAGDAFAAGVLFGLHEGWTMEKNLELGVSSACSSLQHVSASEGVKSYNKCLDMISIYGLKPQK